MSKFKVGDRVEYCGALRYAGFGTITSVVAKGYGYQVKWDNEDNKVYHARKYIKPVERRGILFMTWNSKHE